MARKKRGTKQLWCMLAAIAVILALLIFMPDGTKAPARNDIRTEEEAQAEAEAAQLVKEGMQAPDFTVELFDGGTVTLSQLQGKVVLLTFWATWCPPCCQEMSQAQTAVVDRFAGRDFVFLPISRGEERADVAAFRQKHGYTFPMGLDTTRAIFELYATKGIPRNFVIGPDGCVIKTSIDYTEAEFTELMAAVDAALTALECATTEQ